MPTMSRLASAQFPDGSRPTPGRKVYGVLLMAALKERKAAWFSASLLRLLCGFAGVMKAAPAAPSASSSASRRALGLPMRSVKSGVPKTTKCAFMYASRSSGFNAILNRGQAPISALALVFQECVEPGERPVRAGRLVRLPRAAARPCVLDARVLVLVAIDAQELPVGAVGRIVVVVAVLVVHRELAQARGRKLARTAGADPGQELERLLAVAGGAGRH